MTFTTHVVFTRLIDVDLDTGNVIQQDNPNTRIHDVLRTEQQHRVIPDAAVPNSAGFPTIADYLALEGAADFEFKHMDQYIIVTQRNDP